MSMMLFGVSRTGYLALLPCVIGAIQCMPALADEGIIPSRPKGSRLDRPMLVDPYTGVVVNQTITLVGHDFYQAFVAAWRDKPLSERYALTVGERPSPQLGSQVWVEFSRRRVFQAILPPARARIGGIGEKAAEIAYQNVVQTEVQRLLFRDPDIGPDEI